jgi:hypothetical protein
MAKKKEKIEVPEVTFDEVLLKEVVDATLATGFLYAAPGPLQALADLEYVEINADFKDADGNVGARATQKGIDFINGSNVNKAPIEAGEVVESLDVPTGFDVTNSISKGEYTIATVAFPGSRRTGRSAKTVYPFDDLEAGQSFFIAAEEGQTAADVQKKYVSTVSYATSRFAVPIEGVTRIRKLRNGATSEVPKKEATRQFKIRAVADGAPWGKAGVVGAGVWRVK